MLGIKLASWGSFALAALGFVLFVNEGFVPFLAASVACALSGVLLLAIDRALVLLAEIRDALCAPTNSQEAIFEPKTDEASPRSAVEIGDDLERMRKRL